MASRLKDSDAVIADGFPDVTVLFAEIVGFTPLAERLAPTEVVLLLDRVFADWDALAARIGLEKIKTIGDAYMVAAGIPLPREDHAEAIAEMALEMRSSLARRSQDGAGRLEVRIGIDSGPVVAGVIGRAKFSYDLWGDTVNTAARMESHGLSGEIQVTQRTYESLRHRFQCPAERSRSRARDRCSRTCSSGDNAFPRTSATLPLPIADPAAEVQAPGNR